MRNIRLNEDIRNLVLGAIGNPIEVGLDGLILSDNFHELINLAIERCPKLREEAEFYYPNEFKMLFPEYYKGEDDE